MVALQYYCVVQLQPGLYLWDRSGAWNLSSLTLNVWNCSQTAKVDSVAISFFLNYEFSPTNFLLHIYTISSKTFQGIYIEII